MLAAEVPGQLATLTARSIRVGSYKSFCKEKIVFAEKAIQITVPHIMQRKIATLPSLPFNQPSIELFSVPREKSHCRKVLEVLITLDLS